MCRTRLAAAASPSCTAASGGARPWPSSGACWWVVGVLRLHACAAGGARACAAGAQRGGSGGGGRSRRQRQLARISPHKAARHTHGSCGRVRSAPRVPALLLHRRRLRAKCKEGGGEGDTRDAALERTQRPRPVVQRRTRAGGSTPACRTSCCRSSGAWARGVQGGWGEGRWRGAAAARRALSPWEWVGAPWRLARAPSARLLTRDPLSRPRCAHALSWGTEGTRCALLGAPCRRVNRGGPTCHHYLCVPALCALHSRPLDRWRPAAPLTAWTATAFRGC